MLVQQLRQHRCRLRAGACCNHSRYAAQADNSSSSTDELSDLAVQELPAGGGWELMVSICEVGS